jgi:RHS repeat-associated protein
MSSTAAPAIPGARDIATPPIQAPSAKMTTTATATFSHVLGFERVVLYLAKAVLRRSDIGHRLQRLPILDTFPSPCHGNQTSSSAGQALAYNAADQTTSLTASGGRPLAVSYAGVGQAERTTAGSTTFTNSLLGVTAATNKGATTATTRDPAGALVRLRSGADRFYYLVDGLGSVVAMTNAAGSVTNSYACDPLRRHHRDQGAADQRLQPLALHRQDAATGLYKIGARYYQPELGRWTQPDPSGLDSNAYLYAAGNPVNFTDASGPLSFGDVAKAVAGAVAGLPLPASPQVPFLLWLHLSHQLRQRSVPAWEELPARLSQMRRASRMRS